MSTPTPPDADPTPDREEREVAALYRRLPQAEPDEALDARVLGAAERAAARRPRRGRWLIGLGSAATLVMAAGLTWQLAGNGPATRPAAAPAAGGDTSAGARRQVVPVHILSAQQAERSRAGRTSSTAVDAMPPPPALAAKAPPAPSTQAPRAAQDLIAQARKALADEDAGRARFLVGRIMQQYPDLKLPADLVPYAPSDAAAKGSP